MDGDLHLQHSQIGLFEYVPLVIVLFIGLVYMILAFLISKEKKWNHWRTFSFFIGTLLLFIALHPPMMNWAHVDMRGHMYQHLLLAMFAPIFFVLAVPVTLILTVSPVGFARKVTSLLRTKLCTILSHPFTAFLLNIGGMFLLYMTPLYNLSLRNTHIHYFVHLHFLLAGYLFTWSIIGTDPVPYRPGMAIRLIALFLSIGAHSFLSKIMYAHLYPKNSPHSEEQIREGAKLMYYWGDFSEILLIIILFSTWYYNRKKGIKQESISL